EPGRPPAEEPAGLDLPRHACELLAPALHAWSRAVERPGGAGGVVGGARDADRHRRDRRPRRIEAPHGALEAGACSVVLLAAEEVRRRHATFPERERRALVGDEPHLVLVAQVLESRRPTLYDERPVPGAPRRAIDCRPHDDPV